MEAIRGIYEKVKGSGIWWIYWTDGNGKRHREKAGRISDAKTLLNKRKTEVLQGKKLPELQPGKVITFGDLVKDALAHSKAENGERSTHELDLKYAIIGEEFTSRDASNITKLDIQNWLVEQEDEREWSPATRNRYQAAFSLVWSVAIDNGKVQLNPASLIKRKAENNGRIRFMSEDEETLLTGIIAERYPHYLPAFLISLHTGMRAGEQFNLDWRDVSLSQKRITLVKTKGKKIRHIPLNAVALAAFEELAKANGKVGYVFQNTEGNRLQNARDWFEPVVIESKLKDYTWHCNRHTFASRLVMAGVDIRTVANLMGHSTIQMTMRYAHLAPEHNQSAVDKLVAVPVVVPQTQTATGTATGQKRKNARASKSGIKLVKSIA
jgi:site-specific recombinase XerD